MPITRQGTNTDSTTPEEGLEAVARQLVAHTPTKAPQQAGYGLAGVADRDGAANADSHSGPHGAEANVEQDARQCDATAKIQNMIAVLTEQFKQGLQSILQRQSAPTVSANTCENLQEELLSAPIRNNSIEIGQREDDLISLGMPVSEVRPACVSIENNPCTQQIARAYDHGRLVELPKFSGDPIEWPLFERTFHDTTSEFHYNNTRNIIRLRQALTADARAAVEYLLAFPESVDDIMTTLKENFGRPEQLMNRYVHDLRKYPKIHFGNIDTLVKFSNILKNVAALAKYSCVEYRLCDATLLGECVSKLPYELQVQWAEYKEGVNAMLPWIILVSSYQLSHNERIWCAIRCREILKLNRRRLKDILKATL